MQDYKRYLLVTKIVILIHKCNIIVNSFKTFCYYQRKISLQTHTLRIKFAKKF